MIKGTGWGAYFMDEGNATGAVLTGRRTVEQVDHWGGNHHGVPIFVVSHRPPGSFGGELSPRDVRARRDRRGASQGISGGEYGGLPAGEARTYVNEGGGI